MYTENDTMTPRDRIGDDMLRRILDGNTSDGLTVRNNRMQTQNQGRETWGLENYPLASVYAPLQRFQNLYDKETALQHGTIFAELDLPFMGQTVANKGGACRG